MNYCIDYVKSISLNASVGDGDGAGDGAVLVMVMVWPWNLQDATYGHKIWSAP